jgi:DNA-binding NarL/FixJ family response regulator
VSAPGVLVVDDHAVTRAGIVSLLSRADPGLHVVGEAGSGDQALSEWRTLRPDVVLMDLQMLGGDGIEAIARIRAEDANASVVALTAFASDELVAGAFRAGARGYIGKEASGIELVRAVRAASRGETVVSGPATERLHSHLNGASDVIAFTERERQVLAFLEQGCTDREIAAALTISAKTVEKHVGSILRKLGAQNRTQAVARARERVAG